MRADDYPLPPAMDAAYAVCRAVVFETDIGLMQDPRVQARMLELGMLPGGRNVFDTIDPQTRRRLEAKLAETGLPGEIVAGFRPWMIALTLSALEFQRLGFDPNLGVDMHFFNKASADGKRIAALETVEFQLQLLAGMNAVAEEAFLAMTLQDLAQAPELAPAMVGLWRSGDAPGLQQLLYKTIDQHPDVRDRMLAQRNRAWAGKIEDLIRKREPALVIVGAMHLIGPGSVVDLLQARGYRVEQR
ncbi:MAG: TraB/GumN family protein [Syntrophobacterales bacterium]|nr:MAG: TraB/GumN family protein [Syntrophobacterales bacterium]